MKVLKFGGSSIGDAAKIKNVRNIIKRQDEKCIIIVSAFQDVTDELIRISVKASNHNDSYKTDLEKLTKKHVNIVREIIPSDERTQVVNNVKVLLHELEEVLYGVYLIKDLTSKILDSIQSYGERISAYIFSNYLENAKYIDVTEIIKTDDCFGKAKVNFKITNKLIKEKLHSFNYIPVVPGFIASTEKNVITTLGRGGSDYTAAIIAAATEAEVLEIWTDVDGFMTADPKKVDKAYGIDSLSYAEAMELSHFGAQVVYTPTIQPVYQKNIPLVIKNTFNPSATGTIIEKQTIEDGKSLIKGISSIDNVDLITLQGPLMVGVSGTSSRLFGALAESKVNIIMITQASSEFSISFVINPEDTEKAKQAINKEFNKELSEPEGLRLIIEKSLSVIAIVGEKMKNTPGISANLFTSLGRNGISVIATAQGSSELNISVVIRKASLKKALNVIHEGFFLSNYKDLHLFIVGTGTVGGSLLKQLEKQQKHLIDNHQLKINLVGVADIDIMLIDEKIIPIENYQNILKEKGEPTDLKKFVDKMSHLNLRNSLFVDCTAAQNVADLYMSVLESYISVVTANKIACSSEVSLYKTLKTTAQQKGVRFMYETNVGAGLPVIKTINDLVHSGDKILKLQAVLSGTLNFIFNVLSEDVPLSKAVKLAQEKGFSEPDPRIDLSGTDVIRKLLILARESGYYIEKDDVVTKSFLPQDCFKGSLDDFWKKIKKYDKEFEEKRKVLDKEKKRWRFVAKLDKGKASIELQEVDFVHPAYELEGSNNIILLTTERYHEQPMIIKGYGAGAEVTAAGVFADIIRVANV